MTTVTNKLHSIINRHSDSLLCAAVINAQGEVSNKTGDFSALEPQSLVSAVLGPYGSPLALFDEASKYQNDRNMLPRSLAQGQQFALIDKPCDQYAVVVFGIKHTSFVQHIANRQKISDTILALFSNQD
ncbi:hypothetical protein [Shewanella sp.]|uniref:hypothetical protein n=1 Tax=Shewanella sp. TaxID=50422 RepID=UPI003A9747DF